MDFIFQEDRIYAEDKKGKILAEITFPRVDENTVVIDHTFVDDSLRGQGIAGQLMEMAVSAIKMQGKKITATCAYAVRWLEKNGEKLD